MPQASEDPAHRRPHSVAHAACDALVVEAFGLGVGEVGDLLSQPGLLLDEESVKGEAVRQRAVQVVRGPKMGRERSPVLPLRRWGLVVGREEGLVQAVESVRSDPGSRGEEEGAGGGGERELRSGVEMRVRARVVTTCQQKFSKKTLL